LAKPAALALVGSESLIGREIRDLLGGNSLGQDLKLIAAEGEETGKLTEHAGEPAILGALDAEGLSFARVIFLAGPAVSTAKVLAVAPPALLIDLSGAAEDVPHARVRAPMVEPAGYQVPDDSVHVVANAAAIALALVLDRLQQAHRIKRALAHIFEPASERGYVGITELERQTTGLLTFKGQPKDVFDAQLAFNMLSRYGEEAPAALADAELRIERHLATLLALSSHAPMPSLRLLQAPVFHGYSISLWVEFESNPRLGAIERSLDSEPIDLRTGDTTPPDVVGIAGQNGVAVGTITVDRNNPQALWLWIVTDNLRLRAENALLVAQELV
jgi:aspartate-semialdehyde dehydrogenase